MYKEEELDVLSDISDFLGVLREMPEITIGVFWVQDVTEMNWTERNWTEHNLTDKLSKFIHLKINDSRMWKLRKYLFPVIIGALGAVSS